jgi:signal transduction histidine kinase
MLDYQGLRAALEWYANQFSARASIAVSVCAGAPHERAAADVEIALFRIAQEALNNVAKHARAKSVVISLERQGSEYVMSVVDDGVGLRAGDAPERRAAAKRGNAAHRESSEVKIQPTATARGLPSASNAARAGGPRTS